jgi:ATP-dependent RNA helicase DeaD
MFPADIHPKLAEALTQKGYAAATPVQASVLEEGTAGRDLLVSARTGSGKTVAFGLAMGPDILGDNGPIGDRRAPLALVVAPTRELALQVQRELIWLYGPAGARVLSCVGGMDIRREQKLLAQGCDIVVGTPGRLCDHIERNHLHMENLRTVVLDEADEMLDLGFREELERILDAAPDRRRTMLFSATIPRPIAVMAKTYQRDALRIVAAEGETQHADIDYQAVRIAPSDIEHATVNLLRFYEAGAAIVFCSTREAVRRLHANLVERGFVVVALSGELSQTERTHALQALRDRRARVCVATDVAARGIDIPDLGLVIHADLPRDAETLQHRSGRTGRAGSKGVCAILVPHSRRRIAERLLQTANIEASWVSPPSVEDIRAKDQERMLEEIVSSAEAVEEDAGLVALLLERLGPEALAAALIRQSRARLPAPEELADSGPPPPMAERGPRQGFENTVWFRIAMGRNRNAEARWILPMICRRGHLTKQDIGAIRVLERETRFEIKASAADKFLEAANKSQGADDVAIELADGAPPPPRTDRKPYRERVERADGPPVEGAPPVERLERKPYHERGERPEHAERSEAERLAQAAARPARPEKSEWKKHDPKAKSAWSPPIDGVVTPTPDKPYKPGWAKPKAGGPKGGKSNDWKAKSEFAGEKPKGEWKPKGPPGGFKGKPGGKPKFKPRAPK